MWLSLRVNAFTSDARRLDWTLLFKHCQSYVKHILALIGPRPPFCEPFDITRVWLYCYSSDHMYFVLKRRHAVIGAIAHTVAHVFWLWKEGTGSSILKPFSDSRGGLLSSARTDRPSQEDSSGRRLPLLQPTVHSLAASPVSSSV